MRHLTRRSLRFAAILLAACAAACGLARAQEWPADALIDGITLASGGLSLDQAVDQAQRRYKARVVRADVHESDGRTYYVLRLLSKEGRVWTVRVDAATGEFQ